MELTRYDTSQPFVVADVDDDSVVTVQRKHEAVRVHVGGAGFGSTGGVAWLSADDAAKLSMFLLQAAIDARNAALNGDAMLPARRLDNCPKCHKRITDFDDNGCETSSGQRWCINHLIDAS